MGHAYGIGIDRYIFRYMLYNLGMFLQSSANERGELVVSADSSLLQGSSKSVTVINKGKAK